MVQLAPGNRYQNTLAAKEARLSAWDGTIPPGTSVPIQVDVPKRLYGKEARQELSAHLEARTAYCLHRFHRWVGYDADVCFFGFGETTWLNDRGAQGEEDEETIADPPYYNASFLYDDRTSFLSMHAMVDRLCRDRRGDTLLRGIFLPEAMIFVRNDAARMVELELPTVRNLSSTASNVLCIASRAVWNPPLESRISALVRCFLDIPKEIDLNLKWDGR